MGTIVACTINILVTGFLFRWERIDILLSAILTAILMGQIREDK